MVSFIHQLDVNDENQIVEHFQNIPDIMEYILESEQYPLTALHDVVTALEGALNNGRGDPSLKDDYARTIAKIHSVISTRIDYVNSIIDSLLGSNEFDISDFSLENSPTQEILAHIDLMKDVSHSSEISTDDYKAAMRKFIKTLKFRFNKGLEIHKALIQLGFEVLAEREDEYPQEVLEEYRNFLEDALAMTRSHIPVKPSQIHQLKETLFKILEAMGVRILQHHQPSSRAEYGEILRKLEELLGGLELDFGQKVVDRFADMLPEYIADHWNFDVIKHNRKLVGLLIDCTEDAALLGELYKIITNLTIAEATQTQRKQELAKVTLKDIQGLYYVKNEENALQVQMEKFKSLTLTEQARELIKLSLYGLCDYLSKFSVEILRKYPVGILKSTEKMLNDLEQHRLRDSEVQGIRDSAEYYTAVELIEDAIRTYEASQEKYNFVDIYKETDFTVESTTYCAFNDIILRLIQNVMEAYFIVDSDNQKVSEHRLAELKITISERYKREWIRQNELRQASEQLAMEELAQELI